MNPIDNLDSIESAGRRMPRVLKNPVTEAVDVYDMPSRPCPGCRQVTLEGDVITKLFRVWWHHDCAKSYLREKGKDEAWLVLGRQLSDRPTHFNATQTRAIVDQLVRIASDGNH
jgi:hypothetical protein